MAIDDAGNLYVAEWGANQIRRITPEGVVTTFAGNTLAGFSDGIGATARFNQPDGIVFDARGCLYVTEHSNHAVRRVALDGTVTSVAGTGKPGFVDGGKSVAQFSSPGGIALDASGNLIIADTGNHSLRLIQFNPPPGPSPVISSAIRRLPVGYVPGVKLIVALETVPSSQAAVYAVEDGPPPAWKVENISHGGAFDSARGKVKFGPYFDALPRTLTYEVTPPLGETGSRQFAGTTSVDGSNVVIGGNAILGIVVRFHPADRSPVDNRILIGELTSYSAAWRRGTTWPVAPNPIPIDYVTRAGFLWRSGERYSFDPQILNAPSWWISNPAPPATRTPQSITPANVVSRPTATRRLPAQFVPTRPLCVTLSVSTPSVVMAYAVEDQIPVGWEAVEVSHEGEFDRETQRIKWGPFFDATTRELSYVVRSDRGVVRTVRFQGAASFDGTSISVAGESESHAGIEIRGLNRVPGGEIELEFLGPVGASFDLEVSTDLVNWNRVAAAVNREGVIRFADQEDSSAPQRFYRLTAR